MAAKKSAKPITAFFPSVSKTFESEASPSTRMSPEQDTDSSDGQSETEPGQEDLSDNDNRGDVNQSPPTQSLSHSDCSCFCCTTSDIYQPKDSDVLKKTERTYGSGNSMRIRHLQPSWYKSHPWLHFCCTSLKLYCWYCKTARNSLTVIQLFQPMGFATGRKPHVGSKSMSCLEDTKLLTKLVFQGRHQSIHSYRMSLLKHRKGDVVVSLSKFQPYAIFFGKA